MTIFESSVFMYKNCLSLIDQLGLFLGERHARQSVNHLSLLSHKPQYLFGEVCLNLAENIYKLRKNIGNITAEVKIILVGCISVLTAKTF